MPLVTPACLPTAVYGLDVSDVAGEDDTAELAEARVLAASVRHAVARLSAREQALIVSRYGLFGVAPRSLRELAELTGEPLTSLWRREARAVAKLAAWV